MISSPCQLSYMHEVSPSLIFQEKDFPTHMNCSSPTTFHSIRYIQYISKGSIPHRIPRNIQNGTQPRPPSIRISSQNHLGCRGGVWNDSGANDAAELFSKGGYSFQGESGIVLWELRKWMGCWREVIICVRVYRQWKGGYSTFFSLGGREGNTFFLEKCISRELLQCMERADDDDGTKGILL